MPANVKIRETRHYKRTIHKFGRLGQILYPLWRWGPMRKHTAWLLITDRLWRDRRYRQRRTAARGMSKVRDNEAVHSAAVNLAEHLIEYGVNEDTPRLIDAYVDAMKKPVWWQKSRRQNH